MLSRVTQEWEKCRKYHRDKDGEDMKKLYKKFKKNTQKQKSIKKTMKWQGLVELLLAHVQ